MSIPFSSLADGLEKTLGRIEAEILERLQNSGLDIHCGIPTSDALGSADNQVWYAPLRIERRKEHDTLQSEAYASRWAIHFIVKDQHNERGQTDFKPLFRHIGRTVEALNNTQGNKGLDGAIDWGETENIEFFQVDPASPNDRGFIGISCEVLAHHPLWPIRVG